MPKISKIKLPDGTVYDLADNISNYQQELIAGDNITIVESSEGPVISSAASSSITASVSSHTLFIQSDIPNGDNTEY